MTLIHQPFASGNVSGRRSVEIDSTLELTSDGFKTLLNNADAFLNASRADVVNESLGLVGADAVQAIVGGKIDEYEIEVRYNEFTGRIRGRDAASVLGDSTFSHTYKRPATAGATAQPVESVPAAQLAETTVGVISAAGIANAAVTSAGLTLSWQVPDYTILAPTYSVSGRILDILRTLAEPWSQVAPFKVDIIIDGTTVIVRQRTIPGSVNYTFDAAAFRQSQLNVRKRPLRLLGTVTLRGLKVPASTTTTKQKGGVTIIAPTPQDPNTVPVSSELTEISTSTTYDATGQLQSYVASSNTYLMPERLLLRQTRTEYTYASGNNPGSASATQRSVTVKEYEDITRDASGALNSPKPKFSSTVIDSADANGALRTSEIRHTSYTYDGLGFQIGESTFTRKLDETLGALVPRELLVVTVQDIGALLVEKITSRYRWVDRLEALVGGPTVLFNQEGGVVGGGIALGIDRSGWELSRVDTQISGGHRPGGPNRGQSQANITVFVPNPNQQNQQPTPTSYTQIEVSRVFNTGPNTLNVQYSNENLTLDQLNYILDQFAQSDGLWEYEVIFSGIMMPWMRRGQTVRIVNIPLPNDVMYATPNLFLLEIRGTYDESVKNPSMLQQCRAFGYASS